MDEGWREEMARFYRELETELASAPVSCDGCGRCCRFDEADHVLYASTLERLYLAYAGGSPPTETDASEDLLRSGRRCPYQAKGRCLARAGRTLGCRLFFCRQCDAEAMDAAERWHRRLKALHVALGADWDYGPLLPLRETDNA